MTTWEIEAAAERVRRNIVGRGYYSAAAEDKIVAAIQAAAATSSDVAEFLRLVADIEDEAYMIGGVLAARRFEAHVIPWDESKSPAENMGLSCA